MALFMSYPINRYRNIDDRMCGSVPDHVKHNLIRVRNSLFFSIA
jgi:hypothetical protein